MISPRVHRCRECLKPLEAGRKATAEFCGIPCKASWNNRRKNRGAELYDLFMAIRFERGLAKTLGLWAVICRMASVWKEEDDRAGRKSFSDPRQVVMRSPRYNAVTTKVRP